MEMELACGDNNKSEVLIDQGVHITENISISKVEQTDGVRCCEVKTQPEMFGEKEIKLKERIANCRQMIESLKLELIEEKTKLQEESKTSEVNVADTLPMNTPGYYANNMTSPSKYAKDVTTPLDNTYAFSTNVDSKLRFDENLMEYEKQLQKYQNTLSMAQNEKKNAIRKQMLTKAYKLKLLEVENQCNIELLRVKQSLQCLEPLQMIVNKWKSGDSNSTYNLNSYELIPRYPELNPDTPCDVNIFTDDEKSEFVPPEEPTKDDA